MKEMSDEMKERIAKWLESLEEEERNQAELLDSYFLYRTNMPGEDPGFGKAAAEPKTTDEIIDDLMPMMNVSKTVVTEYMRAHDYGFTTAADGTPRWAIWRYMDVTVPR